MLKTEIIYCKLCIHYSSDEQGGLCRYWAAPCMKENDFCSRAKRKLSFVKCKECKYYMTGDSTYFSDGNVWKFSDADFWEEINYCQFWDSFDISDTDYCSHGIREEKHND